MKIYSEAAGANRIVIKVGTSTLTYENGRLNLKRIEQITRVISDLMNSGKQVILVTSGAVGIGAGKINMLDKKPETVSEKQAAAAIGQCELMNIYGKFFSEYGYDVAQILLTRDVIDDDVRRGNARNTIDTLLGLGVIPIVNENDSISTEELVFGDNDTLSAVVAIMMEAELLIILSDIDGLFDADPNREKNAKLIPVVERIDDHIRRLAGGAVTRRGTGGMITKVKAAELAVARMPMIIVNGREPDILYDVFDGKPTGTLFLKEENK